MPEAAAVEAPEAAEATGEEAETIEPVRFRSTTAYTIAAQSWHSAIADLLQFALPPWLDPLAKQG